jgi:hypothetical protein
MVKRTFLKALHPEIALEVERNGVEDDTSLMEVVKLATKAETFLKKYHGKGIISFPTYRSTGELEASHNPFS